MKTVLHQLGRYKRDTLLCIGLTTFEVIMEILLPFITSIIIDQGLEASNLPVVYRYGILMVVMAFLGLVFGATAGKFAAIVCPLFIPKTGTAASCSRFFYPSISSTNPMGLAVISTQAGRKPLRKALRTDGRLDHAAQ